jgi:[acyl-carrier-protein] S-malonyltransferase
MSTLAWRDGQAPLAANHSGELVDSGDDIREALIAQIASPVRWVQCVHSLIEAGSTTFLEVGPGRVLSGLIRQIDPGVETFAADSREKLSEFADAHPQFVR